MPTYEYGCQDCGAKFECQRSYKELDNEVHCVVCNSLNTKRLISRIFIKNQSGSLNRAQSSCSSCSGTSCSSCNH